MAFCPFHGMNLIDACRLAKVLGFTCASVRRTGEIRFQHHWIEKPIRINGRRKGAPRKLTGALIRVYRRRLSDGHGHFGLAV